MAADTTVIDVGEKKETTNPLQEYEAMKQARLMSIRESRWSTMGKLGRVAAAKKTGKRSRKKGRTTKTGE